MLMESKCLNINDSVDGEDEKNDSAISSEELKDESEAEKSTEIACVDNKKDYSNFDKIEIDHRTLCKLG